MSNPLNPNEPGTVGEAKRFKATPTANGKTWIVNDTLLHRIAAVFNEADYGLEAQEQAEICEVVRNREWDRP